MIMSLFVVLLSTGVFASIGPYERTQATIVSPAPGANLNWYVVSLSIKTPEASTCFYQPYWRKDASNLNEFNWGMTLPLLANANKTVHTNTLDFTEHKYMGMYGVAFMCNGNLPMFNAFYINDGTTAPIITLMCDMTQAECDQQSADMEELNLQAETLNNNILQLEADIVEKESIISQKYAEISEKETVIDQKDTEISQIQSSITDLNSQISTISADKQLLTGQLGECRETVLTKEQEISSLISEIEGMSMLNEFASYMTLAQKRSFMCEYMKNNGAKTLELYNVKCDSTYFQKANGRWSGSCKCKATA